MFKKIKPRRKSPDEPYLIAHILRQKGSVASLINYVKNHPGGADAARKDIINIKYWFSKCSVPNQNLVRKMVNRFERFNVERDYYYSLDDDTYSYKVRDLDNEFWFRFDTQDFEIRIKNSGTWSNDEFNHKIFHYATLSIKYMHENIEEMRSAQLAEEMKQKYVETYKG